MEKLRIEETIDKYSWRSREYFPSGILTFRMWMHFRWYQKIKADGKQSLEDQLSSILACLELMAQTEIEKKIRQEEEHKIWLEEQKFLEEKQKIVQEIKKRKEKELSDFKKLIKQSKRWYKAQVLRAFICEVEKRANDIDNNMSEELKLWISWARDKVDWYDPLTDKEDPLLSAYEKHSLFVKR